MLRYFVIIFFVSAGAAVLFTPLVKRIALAAGIVDKPGGRKIHRQNIPLLGGVAIAAAFFAGIAVVFCEVPAVMDRFSLKLSGLCVGGATILLLGIIDDIRPLKAKIKLVIQLAAASVLISCGFSVEAVTIPFFGKLILGISGAVFSMLWIVGITNAINLLDGLDGLAAGVSGIASFFIFLSAVEQYDYVVAFLAVAIVGACAGFLPFNFYPARIFMGNSGSMFLGFILSAISIVTFQKSRTIITLLIPVIALGVPIIDTTLAIARRLAKKKHVFQADKEHIHHKLFFREESQSRVVLSLYFLSACFGMIALSLRGIKGLYAVAALLIVIVVTYRWMKSSGFLDFR